MSDNCDDRETIAIRSIVGGFFKSMENCRMPIHLQSTAAQIIFCSLMADSNASEQKIVEMVLQSVRHFRNKKSDQQIEDDKNTATIIH